MRQLDRRSLVAGAAALAIGLGALALTPMPAAAQQGDQIYGSQLMTEQERMEYRERMRNARTQEERERIRSEHHMMVQERAKQRGVELPPEPPAGRGGGMQMHKGGGMGRGG
ncbi:hypothetical protein [Futiania mangrovi]|uniref:Secreted protein n=1 Tax=Futiania mangrovi TaxID=2959716 RepID=A0A9J6PBB3_9PROT|nr:hypothetical protein [Futiania mangrovii]MCP1335761.1 hypothetical protein [Futiania mangrovii]